MKQFENFSICNELLREPEQAAGPFWVRFVTLENKLLRGGRQTIIEVRWNIEKLPLHTAEQDEDPTVDVNKRKVTLERELTHLEKENFLKNLETVNSFDQVFHSLIQ